jgi:hypothetical protein
MADNPPGRSLAAGALSGRDVVVMALASSGPTQSVAVSLAAILATVAYAGFLPILICFIPRLGMATSGSTPGTPARARPTRGSAGRSTRTPGSWPAG